MKYINCFILLFLLCGCGGTADRHDSPFLPFGREKTLMAEKVFFGEMFDYEGKSLTLYTFGGPAPLLFDVDEDAGVPYGYHPDADDCFLKYNLND